jgi:ubiquinone/menaquinone biosynthesis C-methylase UbiE
MLHAYLDKKDNRGTVTFLNYGYAYSDGELLGLLEEDEINRYCIQLYNHVATAIDVEGLDLIEVGCGRGGGASYITRYLKPKSYIGIDQSAASTAFCNNYHEVEGLSFVMGDAEDLPLESESKNAVVNVESSRCYRHMEIFLSEVYRVLKPGGHLLFADLRNKELMPLLRSQFSDAGFVVKREVDINDNVVASLDMDHHRREHIIGSHIPAALKNVFNDIAGVKGSIRNTELASGELEYWSFCLQKPE